MAIVPLMALPPEGWTQEVQPGGALPLPPQPEHRFLDPVPLTPSSPELLNPNTEGFEIFDSERSRQGCVEEAIPFPLERLHFEYADSTSGIYSDEELLKLATPLIEKQDQGKRLTVSDLCDFVETVTGKYVADGYYTSRALLPEQELRSDGTLTIRIVEGKILIVAEKS